MDFKKYISSGILELYAMGTLSPTQMQEVDALIKTYPEIGIELNAIKESIARYGSLSERNSKQSLNEKTLGQNNRKSNPTIPYLKHRKTYRILLSVSLVALICSTFASMFFFTKWSESADKALVALNEQRKVSQSFNLLKVDYTNLSERLMVMRDPEMSMIPLIPADSSATYKATLYYDKYNGATFVDVLYLPIAPEVSQYQLWAMVDSQFVNVNMIDVAEDRIQKMKPLLNVSKWAVTLEPKGGSSLPTLDQMILTGKL